MILRIFTILHKIFQDISFIFFIFQKKFGLIREKKFDLKLFFELQSFLKEFGKYSSFEKKVKIDKEEYPDFLREKIFLNIIRWKDLSKIRRIKEIERGDFFYLKFLQGEVDEREMESFLNEKVKKYIFPNGFIWRDGLEASIWFVRFSIFISELKENKRKKYYNYLTLLGMSIEKNLSLFGSKNNHYMGELCALYSYYRVISNDKRAERISRLIEREFFRQFSPFGIYLEGTSYQIQVLEWLFLYLFFKDKPDEKFLENVKKAFNFLENYFSLKHNISIGDNDDGNIVSPPFTLWGRYLFLRYLYSKYFEDLEKVLLPLKSGYYMDSLFNDFFLILKCGEVELPPFYVHSHADNGSFIIFFKEFPFLVDSGTYCYRCDPKLRGYFRGVSAHNVFLIDGNFYKMRSFFGWKKLPEKGEISEVKFLGDKIEIDFSVSLDKKVKIMRHLIFSKNKIQIRNSVKGINGKVKCFRYYNFHPSWDVLRKEEFFLLKRKNFGVLFSNKSGSLNVLKGENGKMSLFSEKFYSKVDKFSFEIVDEIWDGKEIVDNFEFLCEE